jgi:hypothetical protein
MHCATGACMNEVAVIRLPKLLDLAALVSALERIRSALWFSSWLLAWA